MANNEDKFKKIIAHAKEYGFVFPSSEIYDGLSATYDYGQYGVELKNNIKDYWWKSMVQYHENIVGLDAAIFMHPTVWKASGHVDAFNDPMIDNKDSKKRYRADVLVEDHIAKIEGKIEKEVEKAEKRFGDTFDKNQFVTTNPRVVEYNQQIDTIKHKLYSALEENRLADIKTLIEDLGYCMSDFRIKKLDGCPAVQPDVFNTDWFSYRRNESDLPQARNGSGNFCELPKYSENRQDEDSFWNSTDRESIP